MSTLQTTGIGVLQDRILPYAGAIDPAEAYRLATRAGGIVLSGRRGLRTAGRIRALGYDGVLLLDPAEYASGPEQPGDAALFAAQPNWVAEQQRASVSALLTPCRVIPVGHGRELGRFINEGNRLAARADLPTMTVLALPRSWLLPPHLDELLRAVGKSHSPLALALGDSNDPLGTEAAIHGLLQILAAAPSSGLIRTDIAALGALAHGALFGAIGLGTTHRHFVPPSKRAGGNRQDRSVRLFVRSLLSFKTAAHLASVAGRDRSGTLNCPCDECDGKSLERFEDDRLRPLARIHDVLSWGALADHILSFKASSRKGAWRQLCHEALEAHERLENESTVDFAAPAHLKTWARFSSPST